MYVAVAVLFLLDPVQALCGVVPVEDRVEYDCARLVAAYVLDMACSACGVLMCGVAHSAMLTLSVPFPFQVHPLACGTGWCHVTCWAVYGQSALGDAASYGVEADIREGRVGCLISFPVCMRKRIL